MSPSQPAEVYFRPSADVSALLAELAERAERRSPDRAVSCRLEELALPGYFDQCDPQPRLDANRQLAHLARLGWLRLGWLPGQEDHLLEQVALLPGHLAEVCALLGRQPLGAQRARLSGRLRAELFRLTDWRLGACQAVLANLAAGRSPLPFRLGEDAYNEDLLAAWVALAGLPGETPYRMFSVHIFNDSKRLEPLLPALVRLARLGRPDWEDWTSGEVLGELHLVPNPAYIYLHGAWELVDARGECFQLHGFDPALGFPAAQAAGLLRAAVRAPGVVCIENATSFYAFARRQTGLAALCLWGNPAPATRHLLASLSGDPPLWVWADLDYGGLNILSFLRREVSPRFQPYCMDIATLEAHFAQTRPLTPGDVARLERIKRRPELADVLPLIDAMLRRGVKLEQEALGQCYT